MTARRVLYVLTSDLSRALVRGQLDHLAENGFDVAVACGSDDPDGPTGFDASARVHRLPIVREPSPWADLRALSALVRLMRSERPDIVNASTPKAALLGLIAAWLMGVPKRVWVIRGFRFETMSGAGRLVMRTMDRLCGRLATHVVVNSASLLALAEDERIVRPGQARLLARGSGNGVDVHRFEQSVARRDARRELGLPEIGPVIGFVGRLTRDKGIDDLADLLTGRFADRPDLRVLLVGDQEPGDPVSEATRIVLSSDPRIVHVPWTPRPELALRAMDVLVFPSYREGLPNVPLEAQAAGTPIVAYASTGTVDAVLHGIGGLLVGTGDVAALGASVDALLTNTAIRKRMSEDGPDWVRHNFDRYAVWSSLVGIYADTDHTVPVPAIQSTVALRAVVNGVGLTSGNS